MGLFNDLGRKAERLKRRMTDASEGEATHACTDCETLLYADHEACPECGADSVVALDGV